MTVLRSTVRSFLPRPVRNWIRSPVASARWIGDEVRYSVGLSPTIRIRDGWRLNCHAGAFRNAYHAQQIDPDQVAELDCFVSHCRNEMLLFDLGAHYGLFSLASLHYGGPDAKAVAVDPSPAACRMIKIESRLNSLSDRLHVVRASVGDETGVIDMVAAGVAGAGYYVSPRADHGPKERTQVRAVTVNDLVDRFGRPTHVKIDVEGAEAAVLRVCDKMLGESNSPIVFLELHNHMIRTQGGAPTDTLEALEAIGYQAFAYNGHRLSHDYILNQSLIRVVAKKGSADNLAL